MLYLPELECEIFIEDWLSLDSMRYSLKLSVGCLFRNIWMDNIMMGKGG